MWRTTNELRTILKHPTHMAAPFSSFWNLIWPHIQTVGLRQLHVQREVEALQKGLPVSVPGGSSNNQEEGNESDDNTLDNEHGSYIFLWVLTKLD